MHLICLLRICTDQQEYRGAKVERKHVVECQLASLGERPGQLIVSTCLSKINKQPPIYKVLGDHSRETTQTISTCYN